MVSIVLSKICWNRIRLPLLLHQDEERLRLFQVLSLGSRTEITSRNLYVKCHLSNHPCFKLSEILLVLMKVWDFNQRTRERYKPTLSLYAKWRPGCKFNFLCKPLLRNSYVLFTSSRVIQTFPIFKLINVRVLFMTTYWALVRNLNNIWLWC